MIFCIDIGNTSIHGGSVNGENVDASGDIPTKSFLESPAILTEAWGGDIEAAEGVSFCSVVPACDALLAEILGTFGKPVFQLTHETCKGLNLRYPKPAEIGQDRIANAIAAQEFYGVPAVVIDMGTAVTFDIVTSEGYEGGIIAPGLAMMTRYLHEQTALLPELSAEDLVEVEGIIGKSTVHAMKLGMSVGFSGMVSALLDRVLEELASRGEGPVEVLSTGGSVANLTRSWTDRSSFVEDLTLKGLAVAFERRPA